MKNMVVNIHNKSTQNTLRPICPYVNRNKADNN